MDGKSKIRALENTTVMIALRVTGNITQSVMIARDGMRFAQS